jgi:hypothetical protein
MSTPWECISVDNLLMTTAPLHPHAEPRTTVSLQSTSRVKPHTTTEREK